MATQCIKYIAKKPKKPKKRKSIRFTSITPQYMHKKLCIDNKTRNKNKNINIKSFIKQKQFITYNKLNCWKTVSLSITHISETKCIIVFPKYISLLQVQQTLTIIEKQIQCIYNKWKIDMVVTIDIETQQCILHIHPHTLHMIQLFGLLNRFQPPDNMHNVLKPIPIFPLLLRLYCHDFCTTDIPILIQEPRLYVFTKIVTTWCNFLQPFINKCDIDKILWKPTEKHFNIYKHFHEYVDLWYTNEEQFENHQWFVDSFLPERIAQVMGKFLCMRAIRYIRYDVFLILFQYMQAMFDDNILETKYKHLWYALRLPKSLKIFAPCVGQNMITNHLDISSIPIHSFIDIYHLANYMGIPEKDYREFQEEFISQYYCILCDPLFNISLTHIKLIMSTPKLDAEYLNTLQINTNSRNISYLRHDVGNLTLYNSWLKDKKTYMEMVNINSGVKEEQHVCKQTKQGVVIKRVNALEKFLSILDHQLMYRKRRTNENKPYTCSPYNPSTFELILSPNVDLPVDIYLPLKNILSFHHSMFMYL
jgi:hypothetical protein